MPSIIRYEPFKEMVSLQDRMNRLFEEAWGRSHRPDEDFITGTWAPAVDVRETKESLEISVELPGMDPKDVAITVENNILTLRGSREFEKADEGETYHRVERAYGAFERSFTLPRSVNAEKINAKFKQGVLHLSLPKREETKPRSVKITVDEK